MLALEGADIGDHLSDLPPGTSSGRDVHLFNQVVSQRSSPVILGWLPVEEARVFEDVGHGDVLGRSWYI